MRVIIFAALALVQIHTGKDLVDACNQSDTTACDAFLRAVVKESADAACFSDNADEAIRHEFLSQYESYTALHVEGVANDKSAKHLAQAMLGDACSQSN